MEQSLTNDERLHNLDKIAFLTDVGNAKRLVGLYRDSIRYVPLWESWVVYDGKRWVKDTGNLKMSQFAEFTILDIRREGMTCIDLEEQARLLKHAHSSESDAKIKAMINRAKSQPSIIATPEEFDKDIWLFNCDNGTIDLRKGELKPHDPLDMVMNLSPIKYDADAVCPIWDKFIDETFLSDSDVMTYIRRRLGYGLSGDTSEEAFDIFYGIGNNGKSKLMDEYALILGTYYRKVNVATIQKSRVPQSGSSHSSDIARLAGARVVWISEPSQGWELDEGKIKDFTGNDPITARHMHEREFQFDPQFKLFIIANYRPRIHTVSKSMWRRLRLNPFNNNVPEGFENKHLREELRVESSGILNWLIKGCVECCTVGNEPPVVIMDATGSYKEDMDRLAGFFELCCIQGNLNDTSFITDNKYLYLVYQAWSKRQGEKYPLSTRTFPEAMMERGIMKHPKRGVHGARWCGIRLKPSIIDTLEEWKYLSDDEIMSSIDGLLVKLSSAFKKSLRADLDKEVSNRQLTNFNINKPESKDSINNNINKDLSINKESISINKSQLEVIEYLKQNYDMIVKPKATSRKEYDKELDKVKELMEREIDAEFEGGVSQESSKRIIEDYCKSREW